MSKLSHFTQSRLIHIKGKLYSFDDLWIMAIVNLSEDSFFQNHASLDQKSLLNHTENLILSGVNIIDVGAASTKPNAQSIISEVEIKKLSNFISSIKKEFPEILISIDSLSDETISFAIDEGADIVNDISGGKLSDSTFKKIVQHNLAYILTYNRGGKINTVKDRNEENILSDALIFLSEKLNFLATLDLVDIIIDPGFGFNKSLDDNFQLLKQAGNLSILEKPILYGLSRKSMIYKTLNISPEEGLLGTVALHTFAAMNGANIFRVHDVYESLQLKKLISKLI